MKKITLVAFVVFAACTSAFSQVEKGDLNLSFNALYTGMDGMGMGQISGKFGYYLTQNIEAGVAPSITFFKAGDESLTMPTLGLYGTYNWLTEDAKLLPYAGASITFTKVLDEGRTGFSLYGGSKYFITEKVNVDGGMQLLFIDGSTAVVLQVGIGFLLGNFK